MAELLAKQKRFCEEYLIDLNGSQAAIRAGYSKKSARSTASAFLTNPNIKSYIDKLMQEKESQLIASQDEVLKYLTSVMRGTSESEEIVIEGLGDGVSEARKMMKTPSEKDRLKAAELIGKRYSIFSDKVSMDIQPIVISGEDLLE